MLGWPKPKSSWGRRQLPDGISSTVNFDSGTLARLPIVLSGSQNRVGARQREKVPTDLGGEGDSVRLQCPLVFRLRTSPLAFRCNLTRENEVTNRVTSRCLLSPRMGGLMGDESLACGLVGGILFCEMLSGPGDLPDITTP